jgi:hypothetical protein
VSFKTSYSKAVPGCRNSVLRVGSPAHFHKSIVEPGLR